MKFFSCFLQHIGFVTAVIGLLAADSDMFSSIALIGTGGTFMFCFAKLEKAIYRKETSNGITLLSKEGGIKNEQYRA